MTVEWNLQLEKTGGKDNQLKDPIGYKQDITEVVVRSAQKSNVTQFDLVERVSPPYTELNETLIMSCFIFRKLGSSLNHLRANYQCFSSYSG